MDSKKMMMMGMIMMMVIGMVKGQAGPGGGGGPGGGSGPGGGDGPGGGGGGMAPNPIPFTTCYARCMFFCMIEPQNACTCTSTCLKKCLDTPAPPTIMAIDHRDENAQNLGYCKLGCATSLCSNISHLQDPEGKSMGKCVDSCSDKCIQSY